MAAERNGRLWRRSILSQLSEIEMLLGQSPSLRRRLPDLICSAYRLAARDARTRTMRIYQRECPWSAEGILAIPD